MMKKNQIPGGPKIQGVNICAKEPVQVYCRLRPLTKDNEIPCLKHLPPSNIQMSSPDTAVNFREGSSKETLYSFSFVFADDASQKTVFDYVALPVVDGLLHGKNGLLFTYGITGSGKTHTMTGTPQNCGIIPRALDVIFNSITYLQAKRFVFKPDRMNGFDIQSDQDATREETKPQTQRLKTPRANRSEWGQRSQETTKVTDVNEDNLYAVFVTYVEIYNNSVFDLLDEHFEELAAKRRPPQSKLVREDGLKNMYVHGVNEVEVKTMEEAFEIFNKGVRNKHMAHNSLNADSSRSHSVFTIRLVQAPVDQHGENMLQERSLLTVSQLSFVDLAGSERTNRTNTSGQRLREAGNINNSLMNLRTCLEVLRENQMNGTNKVVPYRNSKLTHLFKNFFDGASVVRVIVCVNPRSDDYDENIHVMKFAEMSQEVQVVKPTPLRPLSQNLASGRRRANQYFKQAMAHQENFTSNIVNIPLELGVPAMLKVTSQYPDLYLKGPEDDSVIKNLMFFLEMEITKRQKRRSEFEIKGDEFRNQLIEYEKEFSLLSQQNNLISADLDVNKEKTGKLESQLVKANVEVSSLKRQVTGYERVIKRLQEEIKEKDLALSKSQLESEHERQRYQNKIASTAEKISQQKVKYCDKKVKLEMELMQRENKLRAVKRILSDESLATPSSSLSSQIVSASTSSQTACPPSVTIRKKFAQTPIASRSVAVCNPRHRRSRSVSDDRWLEHRPLAPVPLNTVMQPQLSNVKSITKLTDVKDVANTKISKYCLMTQEQDSEGDLETHVYKGDVLPTCGGGAQVVLNDVEILKQKSPSSSPTRKRSAILDTECVEDKCHISIEGHSKRSKH